MAKRETKTFVYEDDDGVEHEVELPGAYEVCPRCRGEGTHVNPSIDGNGITMDEWWGPDWDDESREAYMSGGYDVTCHECAGVRVVWDVDLDRLERENPTVHEMYVRRLRDDAEYDAACRMERRYESGGDW